MTVKLISVTPNYMEELCSSAGQCYQKKVSPKVLISHIIGSGHLSVLEHCKATFEIECSVGVLGQITRHRHLSFTVMSSRGADIPATFAIPKEIRESKLASDYMDQTIRCHKLYKQMVEEEGISLQHASYILPKSTITKITITGNFRAWFEYLPKRKCKRAMPEHKTIADGIHEELARAVPEIFDRSFMGCQTCVETSKCKFH